MKDEDRTKKELIAELNLLREQLGNSDRDNQTLNALIRYSPLAIICLDRDGNVMIWNPAAERIFGWKEEEVLGRKNPIVPEDKQEEYFRLREGVRQGSSYFSQELRRQRKDGAAVYLNAASASLRDFNGKVTASVGIFEDISERKQRERAMRESEERFRGAFENAAVGASIVDTKGRFVKVNRRLCEMLGYSEAELLQRTFSDVTHPEDIRIGVDALAKQMAGEADSLSFEKRYLHRDGHVIHMNISPSVIRDRDGKPAYCVGLWQDITMRKMAEDAIQRTNNLLNAISRAQAEFIADADPHKIFDGLLGRLLSLTNSEYGFIGEVLHTATGEPYLKTYALTNIAWNKETRDFYEKNAPAGLEFFNLKTLFGEVLTTGQPVIANSPGADPRRGGLPEGHPPLRAFLGLPFKRAERFVGMVGIANSPGGYDDELVKHLEPFLATCSNIIEALRETAARKKSEESLLLFRNLLNQSQEAITVNDPATGRFLIVNDKACSDLGYDRSKLLTMRVLDIESIFPDQAAWDAHVNEVKSKGYMILEGMNKRRDGTLFPVEVNVTHMTLGGKDYMVAVVRDITERRRMEEALRKSEANYRALLEQASDGIAVIDEQGRYLDVNSRMCDMMGYSREEFLKLTIKDVIAPEDISTLPLRLPDLLAGKTVISERLMRRKDGSTLPMEISAKMIPDGRLCGIHRDITERKAAEQALRISEERLSKAQKMAHVGNWEWNIVTNELYWSEEVYHIYGVDPAKFIPTFDAVEKAMHPDDREPFLKAVNAAIYERKPFEMDYRLIRPDGTERTVHTIGEVSYERAGKPLIKSGTVQDVTERKKAAEKLRQSEEFIRNILDTVDEGFVVIDRDYRILTANKAYCGQVGITCDAAIGRHCYEISHRAHRPCSAEGEECAVRHVFKTGEPYTAIHRHTDAKGAVLYVETKAFPVKDGTGAVASVIETVNNITERHLLEEERLKTQKLEAIGTLAGGIAHDFNNLLQGVFGYISMAKMALDQKERSLAMLAQAEQALHLSVNLTKQLLTFSKGGKPVKKKMSLRPVIENSVKFALSGSRVDYRITFEEDLRPVEADEGQIGQVIQNIVLNADQAMPLGGTVVITVKNVRAPNAGLPRLLEDGNYVEISVRDSGVGIPEPYLQKIFDPYFTTKERGSGLGLATSYSIVRNHNGVIDVVSKTGVGTTCSVYLPAADAETAPPYAPAVSPVVRKGKILVMDDEELIRNIAGEMLKTCGHEVEFAEHGDAAVEKYRAAREAGSPFDIVILDLTVRGGLGGKETIKRLLAIDPGVRAVVSSGYSDDAVMSAYRTYGFAACLTKPYQIEELSNTLNALLA